VAIAIQSDREREIRERTSRIAGLSSGPRHPAGSEPGRDAPAPAAVPSGYSYLGATASRSAPGPGIA
jgi:hypothetical protein